MCSSDLQYLTGIRDLERALNVLPPAPGSDCATSAAALAWEHDLDAPMPVEEHASVMARLAALALRCDHTRVVTWMLGNERSDRPYPHLGLSESHHMISHHNEDPTFLDKLETINLWELDLLDALLSELASTPEGAHDLLHHTTVLCMAGMSDPSTHSPDDLPVLLAGGEATGLVHGAHHRFPGASVGRLHLTLLQRLGAPITRFGDDHTEPLPGLG